LTIGGLLSPWLLGVFEELVSVGGCGEVGVGGVGVGRFRLGFGGGVGEGVELAEQDGGEFVVGDGAAGGGEYRRGGGDDRLCCDAVALGAVDVGDEGGPERVGGDPRGGGLSEGFLELAGPGRADAVSGGARSGDEGSEVDGQPGPQ